MVGFRSTRATTPELEEPQQLRPPHKFGLFGKFVVIALPFAAVALATLGAIAFERGRDGLEQAALDSVESTARQRQAAVEQWVDGSRHDIARVAEDPIALPMVITTMSPDSDGSPRQEAATTLQRAWSGSHASFTEVFLLDPRTGEIKLSTNPESVGRRRDDQAYFRDGRRDLSVQGPYFSLQSQQPAMTAAAPIHDGDGRLIAVVAGHIDLEPLYQVTAADLTVHASDDIFVITRTGLFVTQPRFIDDPAQLQLGLQTADVDVCARESTSRLRYRDYRGVEVVGAVRYLPELDACVVVKTDLSEAFAAVSALRRDVQLFIGAAVLATAVAVLFTARTLVRPLLALQEGVTRFGRGDLEARVKVRSRDEIGQVSTEFNRMADTISAATRELDDRRGDLEAANRNLRATNLELEAFTYTVSHDLRSPLRAMSSFSQLLAEEHASELSEDGVHCLTRIQHNARAMSELVEDLLAFSRLNREAMHPERLDMEQLARSTVEHLSSLSDHDVAVEIGPLPPAFADRALVARVLTNLVENAVKFTSTRCDARIEMSATDGPGGATYTIRDNGVGFDQRYANKMFEVFQRLHPSEEYEGTGIGLATVQRIVARHGGRVWAEGAVGQGAAFHFTLGDGGGTPDTDVRVRETAS